MFGRADNPKLTGFTSVDQLDNPDITIAYATGSGNEAWVKTLSQGATQGGDSDG